MNKSNRGSYPVLGTAYLRLRDLTYDGEALLLACLMHTKGPVREHGNSKDLEDIRRIMKDPNVE